MISYKKRLKYKYTLHDTYSHPDPTGIEVVKAIDQKMLDLDEDGRLTIHKATPGMERPPPRTVPVL